MSNPEHLAKLKKGIKEWNEWRTENPIVDLGGTDLRGADLRGADFGGKTNLSEADLSRANLAGADLNGAYLIHAKLIGADLRKADLRGAQITEANLSEANLSRADLCMAYVLQSDLSRANLSEASLEMSNLLESNFSEADLSKADLSMASLVGANLRGANLVAANLVATVCVETNFEGADLTDCRVYGISVWNARLNGATQSNLLITSEKEPAIQVDNLEVAQFVYLLLNNERIRHVIDTITSKVVLILGRFTAERKIVLDSIREELRKRDYLPVLFDFEKPSSRDLTETVRLLAHMARFVIADITDARSIPQELMAIVPNLPSVPVQPVLLASQHQYGMFEHLRRFPWVLEPFLYKNQEALLEKLEFKVIDPAEAKWRELTPK